MTRALCLSQGTFGAKKVLGAMCALAVAEIMFRLAVASSYEVSVRMKRWI